MPTLPHMLNKDLFLRIVKHRVTHNVLSLYGVQFASYLLPLITLPYLARVLGPAAWGLVIFAQAYAAVLGPVMEYGFGVSITRDLARHRDNPKRIAWMTAGVLGARAILALIVLLISLVAWISIPLFRQHPGYLAWATGLVIVFGINPMWYFLGLERIGQASIIEIVQRVLITAGTFIFIHHPEDAWMVLALQTGGNLVRSFVLQAWIYREVAWRKPDLRIARHLLIRKWGMAVYYAVNGMGSSLYAVVLGFFAMPAQVGYYGGGDKLYSVASALLGPVGLALFPRMSRLVVEDRARAARVLRVALIGQGMLSAGLGIILALFAPLIVHCLFGIHYQATVPILRVLAMVIPLTTLNSVLGTQWLIPLGHDKSYTRVVVLGVALTTGLGCAFVPALGVIGMAWSILFGQIIMMGYLGVLLRRLRHEPARTR